MYKNDALTIATWNTNGPVQSRGKHAHLKAINFDVAATQECESYPLGEHVNTISMPYKHGNGERCIAILSPHKLALVDGAPECSVAAYVDGPCGSFLFLSVWIKPVAGDGSALKYVRRLPPIFDWARREAGSLPIVIAGDFNCNASFGRGRGEEFRRVSDLWKAEHGLVSAWHKRSGLPMGIGEDPTWRSMMNRRTPEFMIDYIFVPDVWSVDMVRMQETYGSDHRPVIATVRCSSHAAEAPATSVKPSPGSESRTGLKLGDRSVAGSRYLPLGGA